MMEVALRKSDHNRKWFASFDKFIAQNASLDIYERVPFRVAISQFSQSRELRTD
jgi:hypothetical protein